MMWEPPASWTRITAIDAHTEGEPLRVVLSGFPDPGGASILERRRRTREHHDHLRRALMWEPRGHADLYGCLVGPAVTGEADFGVLFTHNEGFSTMCGHGIIGVVTVLLDCGVLERPGDAPEVSIDTPAGLVRARAHREDGLVRRVSFVNVPSFSAKQAAGKTTWAYFLAVSERKMSWQTTNSRPSKPFSTCRQSGSEMTGSSPMM